MAVAYYKVSHAGAFLKNWDRKCGVERSKQRLSQLSVVGRFQDQCLSNESTLCLLSLHKKRSNTVVFLASSFAGQNIWHVSNPVCVQIHLRT